MSTRPASSALKDAGLREFAAGEASSRTRSVIVEACRPPVRPGPRGRLQDCVTDPGELLPRRWKPGSPREPSVSPAWGDSMIRLEAELKRLGLFDRARRNDLSGAFVVDVTPAQLCELAGLPAVQAIRPNRKRTLRAAGKAPQAAKPGSPGS